MTQARQPLVDSLGDDALRWRSCRWMDRERLARVSTATAACMAGARQSRHRHHHRGSAGMNSADPRPVAMPAELASRAAVSARVAAACRSRRAASPVARLRQLAETLRDRSEVAADHPVQVLTIHHAKGLEWDVVFVSGPRRNPRGWIHHHCCAGCSCLRPLATAICCWRCTASAHPISSNPLARVHRASAGRSPAGRSVYDCCMLRSCPARQQAVSVGSCALAGALEAPAFPQSLAAAPVVASGAPALYGSARRAAGGRRGRRQIVAGIRHGGDCQLTSSPSATSVPAVASLSRNAADAVQSPSSSG